MRVYPTGEYPNDAEELAELNAEPWQVELLKINPDYPHWGPHEDYMIGGKGWREAQHFSSWKEFGPWRLDDMNEVVHFYFQVDRENDKCVKCDGEGYNPQTQSLKDAFYAFKDIGHDANSRWLDKITEDEVDALIQKGRLGAEYDPETETYSHPNRPTAAQVNEANAKVRAFSPLVHDAINARILLETRAKRLGIWGLCDHCDGKGYVHTASSAHVTLVLWVLHPRKGASRGVEIKNIVQEDLSAVFGFLTKAAERNAQRFSRVPKG